MQLTGSQIVIECLKEQGVDTVFGYPGGAILNVYDELYKHSNEITHILTSHEQGAAHAADGYARATGKVGVCFATSGPGATNLVTGIATAYMDSIPVVAITCNVGVALLGKDSFQEIDIAGITMPIMVLNPKVVNYRTLFAYHLEPEIFSIDILNEIIREGEKYGITDYPVHIKLDTGMHRLGFLEEDLPEVIDILKRQKVIRPASVFSHLAAADSPELDDYTYRQFDLFDRCCDKLQSAFRFHIMRHILNSTGISRFPQQQNDLVRLGICLYGIPTMNDGSQSGLKQVSSLTTSIISIKEWEAGTTIGYNCRGLLKRRSRIATIPVGYADGINRHLGNGGMQVLINGVRCPSIGNICMDACMIDVTDTVCTVGDRVEIFGDNIPVEEIAKTLDTIPYEILTSVSSRVKRVYYRE